MVRENDFSNQYSLKEEDPFDDLLFSDYIGKGLFFKHWDQFKILEKRVFEILKREKGKKKNIKAWVLGCGTGEDTYSLALSLLKNFKKPWKLEVVASDVCLNSLLQAREGFYSYNNVHNVSDEMLSRYFEKYEDIYFVNNEVKDIVRFDYHNLIHEANLKDCDIIFCKNLLHGLNEQMKDFMTDKIYDAMNSVAFLFLGEDESISGMEKKFKSFVPFGNSIYIKNMEYME